RGEGHPSPPPPPPPRPGGRGRPDDSGGAAGGPPPPPPPPTTVPHTATAQSVRAPPPAGGSPSAAVRQRSIAVMTFSCSRLIWPRLASRQAGPRSRKKSAASRPDRAMRAAVRRLGTAALLP